MECGYSPDDYQGPFDRVWLKSVLPERAALMFEGLPEGAEIPGFGRREAIESELVRLGELEDLHQAVHLTHGAASTASAVALGVGDERLGTLTQLNSSRGGVPKLPLEEAEVTWRGIIGDEHREPRHHGFAWQGLCIWSSEVIGALQDEGHPIGYGYAGENLTVAGFDWAEMRTGLRLEIGEVACELTAPAVPCAKNAAWFKDRQFTRMSHSKHPGWSRWYAAVLSPGTVRPGDKVRALTPG